jgi:hypothetical protein
MMLDDDSDDTQEGVCMYLVGNNNPIKKDDVKLGLADWTTSGREGKFGLSLLWRVFSLSVMACGR